MNVGKLLSFGVVSVALIFAAEDPAVGTWKLNAAKSTFSPGIPKDAIAQMRQPQTMVVSKQNGRMEVTITRGSMKQRYWIPAEGGAMTITEGQPLPPGESINATISPDRKTEVAVVMKDGKEIQRTENVVGPDGKTLTSTAKGNGPDGKPFTIVQVFERQ